MRKSILSLVSISMLATLASACSPSLLKLTEMTPRAAPPVIGDAKVTTDAPSSPLSKVNAQ